MKPTILHSALLMLVLSVAGLGAAEDPQRSEVFPPGLNGVARYRIPGVVVTPKGTLLAYSEARRNGSSDWGEIEVHLRRSSDGGLTWQPSQHIAHQAQRLEGNPTKKQGGQHEQTVNNPVAIVDPTTGHIEFLYCVNYERCFAMQSRDDGLSWSKPVEITASFEPFRKTYPWKVIATGPGHGIALPSGRLVVPIWLAYGKKGDHGPSACGTIYSDDHGRSWKAGEIAIPNAGEFGNPNESILAPLRDGRVMLVARNESKPNRKLVTLSADGAGAWSPARFVDALWEPRCMAGLLAHPSGVLLFSNPHTLPRDQQGRELPNGRGKRENLSIKLSRDEGRSWPIQKTLEPGPSAYSDLAVLPDGRVVCLFERANSIDCASFSLQWLSQP